MVALDVFNSDFFGVVSMTHAMDLRPYNPQWLGSQGLFVTKGIETDVAVIEERYGRLSLVPTSARGTTTTTEKRMRRKGRPFQVPHLSLTDGLMADDVFKIRAFGTENVMETVAQKVADITDQLRMDIEVTKEYHRYGAIQGKVYDSDLNTVIHNYFTDFGIVESSVEFDFLDSDTNTKQLCTDVIRLMHTALGDTMYTGIVGLAGDDWFDSLIGHASVATAYDRWMDGRLFQTQQIGGAGYFVGPDGQQGFNYAGITFLNSRAAIGSNKFIEDDECRFFPLGVPDLFLEINAPADYIETVGTTGKPFYAKQERMRFDKGIEFEVQANPLLIATRPKCLIKGTLTTSP